MELMGLSGFIMPMGPSKTQQTILVVEDEIFIRMSAVATLEDAGYCVLEARNSLEALDILSRHAETSVLMTDVRMPGAMDGLALVAQVRVDHPSVRSIVVSGNTSAEQARSVGAAGFVAKPYLTKTIIQAVHDTVLRH